jgi:tetratricopeptide (TPR) repeat protein
MDSAGRRSDPLSGPCWKAVCRSAFATLVAWHVSGPAVAQESGQSFVECGDPFTNAFGPFDYTDPRNWAEYTKIPIVVSAHFTADVEALRRGVTGTVLGEIDYTLRAIPNHHRALNSVVRYELEKGGIPPNYRSVECWFDRALQFKPDDGMVWLIYGNYQTRKSAFDDALESYNRAKGLMPDNAEVDYNLGLLYLKLGQYEKALEHANAAYSRGYPLEGLKRRLAEKGYPLRSQ